MNDPVHGRSAYVHKRCRCPQCTSAHSDYHRARRAARRATRQLINGRLVAVDATRHGRVSTYKNWCCQCEPCVTAGSLANARTKAAWKARQTA